MRPQPVPEDLLIFPRGRIALALLTLLALAAPPAHSAQGPTAAPERIEVVLDVSADMREPIGEVSRLDLAKVFLTELRAGLRPAPAPALRAYGGSSPRARRDCSDTRLLVGLEAPAGRWSAALDALEATGISPLGTALREAAQDSVTTYVLVTQGGDDCRIDPCTVWKETIGGGPNRRSRLHVVAFAPGPASLEELRCLSRAGSGSLTVIDEAGQAGNAGRRLALVLRNEGVLDVRATLGRGGERVPLPVRVVLPVPDRLVAAFPARAPRALQAGVYRVVLESVPPITYERVMVLPGDTTALEAADIGRLRVEVLDPRGVPVHAPASIRSGNGRRELRFLASGEEAWVRAGTYDVSVELPDSIVVQEDVTVTAGRTTRVAFGGGGTLLVLTPEFETPPRTRVLAYGGDAVDTLTVGEAKPLRAGSYRLVVQTLPVYVTEDVVVRDEGQTVIPLPETGVLGIELSGADGPVAGIRVDVREVLTGEVYGSIVSGGRRLAMPGRYDLEARTVPPTTISAVDVLPGRETVASREGLSRIVVAPPAGESGPWRLEVLTAAGDRRLGEALGDAPELPAWPGTYLARVWRGAGLEWEGSISVASAESARIDWTRP